MRCYWRCRRRRGGAAGRRRGEKKVDRDERDETEREEFEGEETGSRAERKGRPCR